MRTVFAIVGLVVGGLLGAYIGIHYGTEILLNNFSFASPDEASFGNHTMMIIMMLSVGVIGCIVGGIVGRILFKH